jgi:CubicO group peptidase (beta-lactamase class C family)
MNTRTVLIWLTPVVVLVLLALVLIPRLRGPEQLPAPAYWPTKGWHAGPPEAQGFDSVRLAEGLQAIQQKGIDVHSLMVIRDGSVLLDAYFYPYDGSTYHDLASVTKSLMTTLIGIAADQGKLDLDAPMLSFFPDRTIANRDTRKEHITVRHLASMTAGLDCDATGDENTLDAMRASEDWVQFALDRRVVSEPGTRFVYCGLQMHLLSAILQEATEMTALEFANDNLFGPLGIDDVYWPSDPQGYSHGWGDACLHPHDMAKLGFLFLHQGQRDGRQIVSREWVAGSTKTHIATGPDRGEDYGYGWWTAREDEEFDYFTADGRGGQRIVVVPTLNLVLVTTGGGFESDEVIPYVVAAMVDMEKALPANTTGAAQLEAIVAELDQPPAAQAVPPLPETAQRISGQTFAFESISSSIGSLRLDFDTSPEAVFTLELASEQSPRVVGVGLDGVYRPSRGGRPAMARGSWIDEATFEVDYSEGPGLVALTLRMHFDGNRVLFEVVGLGNFEGTLKQP